MYGIWGGILGAVCAALPARDVKEMGLKLLEANAQYLPQFFG